MTTTPEAELPETVAVHIKWLRRPHSVSNSLDAYRVDNRQSAEYLDRLLAVAHGLAERVEAAETEAADARLDAEGWERTAKAAEAREADLLERGDHRGAVLSLRQQRDRLAARVETLEGALAPFGLAPGNFLTYTHGDDGTTCEVAQIVCAPVMEALRALVAPDPNPTDDMCPRCNRKLADHDLATVAAACPDPTEAPSDRCPCEHRWIDHGTAGCGFSYCACVRPNPTDTGDPT